MKNKTNDFPCMLIEQENNYSIILSSFHYFDDYFGDKEGGGYTVEQLAKKLVKENRIKGIKYDSEAGMFCAYSDSSENLLQLCELFRKITGDESKHLVEEIKPLIPLDKAEELLIKGFIKSLDKKAQGEFLKGVPMPALSKKQTEYLNKIQFGTDEEKIYSAKRIDSEARTNIRSWSNYLSHPNTITIILAAIDKIAPPKVYEALLVALVFICGRHLPDLRTQPYFLNALKSKIARHRELGVWGLENIYDFPFEEILPLINDKSIKGRQAVLDTIRRKRFRYPSWMFEQKLNQVNKRPKDFSIFFPLFNEKNKRAKHRALYIILNLEDDELFPKLKELLPIYKEDMKNEEDEYYKREYQETIARLEQIK